MKNKKSILFILTVLIISFIISILFDVLIVNREVLGKESDNNPEIVEMKGIEKEESEYITKTNNSYITFRIKDGYINKLSFNYEYKEKFYWNIEYLNHNKKINTSYVSSQLLNKSIKKVDKNVDEITVIFKNKNIKLSKFRINNDIYYNWNRILIVTISIFILLIVLKFRNYFKNNLDKLFIIVALSFGLLLIIMTPKTPYNSFDDQIHFRNVINIFQSKTYKMSYAEQIVIDGTNTRDLDCFSTNEEKTELYKSLDKLHKSSKDRTIISNPGSNLFTKVVYLPYTIGYKVSNSLNFSFVTCVIISKLCNLLVYIFIFYLALKYSKYGKKIIFVLGLLPTNLFYASQFSYDPTITAGLILAISMFINLLSEEKINKKYLILFIISIVWACLPKAIYCPLLLLLLFIKNKKFDSKKQAIIFKSIIVFITILLLYTFILPAATGALSGDSRGGNTSVTEQLKFIISNPVFYTKVLLKHTYSTLGDMFLGPLNFITFAYLLSYDFFEPLYIFYLVFFLYIIYTSARPTNDFNLKIKLILICELIIMWVLICTALYLSFTPVGENGISGVQNRYFLPLLLPLAYILIPSGNRKEKNTIIDICFPIIMLIFIIFVASFKIMG